LAVDGKTLQSELSLADAVQQLDAGNRDGELLSLLEKGLGCTLA
jgi:hypothetical protein